MILDLRTLPASDVYRFLISAIVPRPIAWVSTLAKDGTVNLAPFSYFVALSSDPPLIGIAVQDREGDPKDTLRNIRETGEWVVNVVDEPRLEAMARTAGEWPRGSSEFDHAGLGSAPSETVRPPRVADSPLQLECRLHREIPLGNCAFVVGEVLLARVDERVLTDGRVDPSKLGAVGRLGGELYMPLREVRRVPRPRVSRTTGEPIG
jgi:flavin reductase (DIM6/NTAB) family NADH-FMN oxidoreductase RutF